jgi:hypothetical protein
VSSAPLQIFLFALQLMLHELSAIFLQTLLVLLELLSKLYQSLPAAFLLKTWKSCAMHSLGLAGGEQSRLLEAECSLASGQVAVFGRHNPASSSLMIGPEAAPAPQAGNSPAQNVAWTSLPAPCSAAAAALTDCRAELLDHCPRAKFPRVIGG